MRIAHVSPYDHAVAGGVREHVVNLARQHRGMGHDVRIVAPSSRASALDPGTICASRAVAPVPGAESLARVSVSPLAPLRVRAILRRGRFDVVHLHEPLVPMVNLAALACSRSVTVGTVHGYRPRYAAYEWFHAPLQRLVDRLDVRVAVSEDARGWFERYFPGRYHVIPDGVDVRRFADPALEPIGRFADGRPTVLFVGRMDKRKGLPVLIDAFEVVQREIPDARLVVAGHYGDRDRLRAEHAVRARGLREVHLVGRVSDEDLPRWYRTADVFCAPSTGFEALGIVLLEAMASGTPVVTTDIEGYRTVVRDRSEAEIVPPGDAPRLAAALVRVLTDPQRRDELAAAGPRRAADYDWPLVARRLLELYVQAGAPQP